MSLFLSTSTGPGGTAVNVSRSEAVRLSETDPVSRIVKSASKVLHMCILNYPVKFLVPCKQMSLAKIEDPEVGG